MVPGDETVVEDLSTVEGIASTVAEIRARTPSTGGSLSSRCSGVVVARDRILTSALCVMDPEAPTERLTADQLSVTLPNLLASIPSPSWTSDVVDVWIAGVDQPATTSDLAVLTLELPIPDETLANVAPVFLGDVEKALQTGALLADDALVSGYGPACAGCGGASAVRQIGSLGNSVFVDGGSATPRLASYVPAQSLAGRGMAFAESTDPWLDGRDRGGPLFLREATSGRYVVVGTYVERQASSAGGDAYLFSYLGRLGDDQANDHAEMIRQHLGTFIDGEPCQLVDHPSPINSNFEAEWWWNMWRIGAGEDHLEDRCDPVPLTTFYSSPPRRLASAPLEFTTRTWLGKGATQTQGSLTARFGFCSCFDVTGNEMPERECLESTCETITLQARSTISPWAKLKVYNRVAPGAWTYVNLVTSTVQEGRLGDDRVIKWDWSTDLSNGRIDGIGGVAVGFLGTSSASTWYASKRDERTEAFLRPTVAHLNLSPWTAFEPHPGILMNRCIFVDCLPFIDPRDIYINIPFASRFDIVNPVVMGKDLVGRIVAPRGEGIWQDISAAIDPTVSEVLSMEGATWLSAVEGASSLAELGINSRAAVVTSLGRVLEIVATKDGLAVPAVRMAVAQRSASASLVEDSEVVDTAATMASAMAQAEAAAAAEVSLPANGRALYSASEGVIYSVSGGFMESGSITKTEIATGTNQRF